MWETLWWGGTYGSRTATEHAAQCKARLRQSLPSGLLPSFDMSPLSLDLLLSVLDRDVPPMESFQDWPYVGWPVNRDG